MYIIHYLLKLSSVKGQRNPKKLIFSIQRTQECKMVTTNLEVTKEPHYLSNMVSESMKPK